MVREITHIRVKNSEKLTTESIIEVKLSSGETRTIETVIAYLGIGAVYYYINSENQVIHIETAAPLYKDSYIRSIKKEGVEGDLMNLPHF